MAEGEYRRFATICYVDGCKSALKSVGLCVRHYQQRRTYGIAGPREMKCGHCQIAFTSEHKKKYCSKRCNANAQTRKSGAKPLAEYLERVKSPHNHFVCIGCGKQSYRKCGGSNLKQGGNKFCSKRCESDTRIRLHAPIKEQREHDRLRARELRNLVAAIRRLAAKRKSEMPHVCVACNRDYYPIKHESRKLCQPCRVVKAAKALSALKATDKYQTKHRSDKAKAKALRMARISVQTEIFDPIDVFKRDKWHCQLCGVSTPLRLRGTYKPAAPELDHVIPLALGGSHTWANVQCACRSCNGDKGIKPLGQLGLQFA